MNYANSKSRPSSVGYPVPAEYQDTTHARNTSAQRLKKYLDTDDESRDVFTCMIKSAAFDELHKQNQDAATKRIKERTDRFIEKPKSSTPDAQKKLSESREPSAGVRMASLGLTLENIFPFVDEFPQSMLSEASPWAIPKDTEFDPQKWDTPASGDATSQMTLTAPAEFDPQKWGMSAESAAHAQSARAPDSPAELDPRNWTSKAVASSNGSTTLGYLHRAQIRA